MRVIGGGAHEVHRLTLKNIIPATIYDGASCDDITLLHASHCVTASNVPVLFLITVMLITYLSILAVAVVSIPLRLLSEAQA